MKFCKILTILVFISNCSFDNKTGIWKNANQQQKTEKSQFSEFKTLSNTNINFSEIITIDKNFKFRLDKPKFSKDWKDPYYNENNNIQNFKYKDLNNLTFRSKKISRYNINNFIFSENENIISSDTKGNLIIFSIKGNKVINKFNFYKKKYKKLDKVLNIIIENNIIYVSDNLGYLYAYNYAKKEIIWAKNYKIPFRSNLKITKDKLIAANQNNNLKFFDKKTGNLLKLIPSEETIVKNQFVNNISLNNNVSYFLNTYGSLYAIDNEDMRIKWFINLNQSMDINPSNLFSGAPIVNANNKIIINSNDYLYILESSNGAILFKKEFSAKIKPLVINQYLFLISKNNYLISMNLNTGKIIYSYDINKSIADFLKIKKKTAKFKDFFIANNKLYLILENSFFLKISLNGSIEDILKLPSKIISNPIFVKDSIAYMDNKKKISIFN